MIKKDAYTDIMSRGQKTKFQVMVFVWFGTLAWFWSWWLQPEHITTIWGLVISSAILFWTTILPGWYFYFAGRMKLNNRIGIPTGRVAMVVTRAPSEPWPVARKTLKAMLSQNFSRPYDVWLADEDPDQYPEIRKWCKKHHVQISSRKGVDGYNNERWPGRKKSKEGNLRYFYETIGYDRYDFVAQMDVDHIPTPSYLTEMIQPFVDPEVGYVAAPSICDNNINKSWAARARMNTEATLHGSLQAGYNGGWAPLCIGSHYAVRTKALKEAGGLGPELAEDHSTTLMLNAAGWRGIFAFNAEAHGDGPGSLTDCLIQEFQWSRSLMTIFLSLTPRYWFRLPGRLKVEFVFAQTWYPLFGLAMIWAYIFSPIVALFNDSPWVNVNYLEFLARFSVLTFFCILPIVWVKKQGLFRPQTAKALSWEVILFQLVRWPWIVIGCAQAILAFLIGKEMGFKVTPKGKGTKPLPIRVILPYLFIIFANAGAALMIGNSGHTRGYYYFTLIHSVTYLVVLVIVVRLHFLENSEGRKSNIFSYKRLKPTICIALAAALVAIALIFRGPSALNGILPLETVIAAEPKLPKVEKVLPVTHLPDALALGIYDLSGMFESKQILIEQVFLPWQLSNTEELVTAVEQIRLKRRIPLVGLEPWPFDWNGMTRETLFNDITSGRYDGSIKKTCGALQKEAPQEILLRWGHEMDLTGQWPWAQGKPEGFISAYQHFVDTCLSTGATNIRFVWSPAGAQTLQEFWPGSTYVDYIGLTALEFEEWSLRMGAPRGPSFEELFDPRYNLVKDYGKPIIICEFGTAGNSKYQKDWINGAFRALNKYPLLKGVVYFYAKSNIAWDGLIPDWRINPNLFPPAPD